MENNNKCYKVPSNKRIIKLLNIVYKEFKIKVVIENDNKRVEENLVNVGNNSLFSYYIF